MLGTGVYGAGKSTVVEDIGTLLEKRGIAYGVLDVDWLGWFDAGQGDAIYERVQMANVADVCAAYLAEGVCRLALARSVRDRDELAGDPTPRCRRRCEWCASRSTRAWWSDGSRKTRPKADGRTT